MSQSLPLPTNQHELRKRVMIISPYFVPMKVVGAKRALHFVRHLPKYNWDCSVMALPADHQADEALVELVPQVPMWRGLRTGPFARREDRKQAQARSKKTQSVYAAQHKQTKKNNLFKRFFDRSFNIFDRYTKYLPWAYRAAVQFLDEQQCDLIYTSAGPFSALKLATLLSKRSGLPLVLDLRDPWTIEPNYRANRNWIGQGLTAWIERACFKQASKIILNTEAAYQAYIKAYQGVIPSERFTFIRNQFDPELYEKSIAPPQSDGPFTIAYFGHLRPSKNSLLFLEAYRAWIDQHNLSAEETQVMMLGEIAHDDAQKLAELKLESYVKAVAPIPFPKAPTLLGGVDLLLDLMGPKHHLQISGKLYDYLACQRPILSISPNLELDQIYLDTQAGQRVDLDQTAIIAALDQHYNLKRSAVAFQPNQAEIYQLSAEPASQRLAHIFDELA